MGELSAGKILVSDDQGLHIIKMRGDVRLNLCVPFDNYIESLFQNQTIERIIFDLSEAEGLDSTTLGLMAKLSVKSLQDKQVKPVVIGASPGIDRLLDMMGIKEFCEFLNLPSPLNNEAPEKFKNLQMQGESLDESKVKQKIIESHLVLMDLSEDNENKFKDLIKTLENS